MPSVTKRQTSLAEKLRAHAAARQECYEEIVIDGPEAAMAERADFEAGFKRQPSGKKNLTRLWGDGLILTVFKRGEFFSWCIAGDPPRFSRTLYESEADAVGGLAGELEVGLW